MGSILVSILSNYHRLGASTPPRDAYPFNNLLYPLLVAFHLQESLNLGQRQVLPVTQGHQLVERAKQLEGIAQDLPLIQTPANAGRHLGKQMQAVDVLEDVRLAVRNEHDVQLVERLVHEAHVILLNNRMLGP